MAEPSAEDDGAVALAEPPSLPGEENNAPRASYLDKLRASVKFQQYDKDGSGRLDRDDVSQLLVEQGIDIGEDQFEAFWNAIDKDGSNDVDKTEFGALWMMLDSGTCFHQLPDLLDAGDELLKTGRATFTEKWYADAEFEHADKSHTGRLVIDQRSATSASMVCFFQLMAHGRSWVGFFRTGTRSSSCSPKRRSRWMTGISCHCGM